MEAEERGSSQEKQEDNVGSKDLLEKLREQLYSSNGSIRRQSGYNLSWMQEDGLEILKAALFGDSPVTTRNAAAYGMRNMRGRMKKMAFAILKQGLKHRKTDIREACSHALSLANRKSREISSESGKIEIREISRRRTSRGKIRGRMHERNRRPGYGRVSSRRSRRP